MSNAYSVNVKELLITPFDCIKEIHYTGVGWSFYVQIDDGTIKNLVIYKYINNISDKLDKYMKSLNTNDTNLSKSEVQTNIINTVINLLSDNEKGVS